MAAHTLSRALAGSLALVAGLGIASPARAQDKFGIFDAARVSEETVQGKEVQSRLEQFRSSKQAQISAIEKELADMQNKLTTQALSLSADKRSDLEKSIQRKALELNQTRVAASREMQMEVTEAQEAFQQKLLTVIQGFGSDEGFSLILEASLVAYADKGSDVTTAIVDRFNRMFPGEPPAAPKEAGEGN
jgi:Skp family chaperone for outer membrane proteins